MLLLIAWRNIWRHKVRSLVVIMSIATGLWAGVFMVAFSWGMYSQYMRETVENHLSHLQVHHPLFAESDMEFRYFLNEPDSIVHHTSRIGGIKSVSARTLATGMVSSATTASGVVIKGVDPEQENAVTGLARKIIQGKYLDNGGKNTVLVGEKLVGKLKVGLKSKIVLTCQDSSGQIVAGAFRIAGIYRSNNTSLDEMNVFVKGPDLRKMLHTGRGIHEIAVLMDNSEKTDEVKSSLKKAFPEADVKTWKELSPELELVIGSFSEFMYIFVGIIMLALTFGIVNTMLMAVMERIREIGMLMAIGMSKIRIFLMIMLETVYLALIGGPLGLLMGYLTIVWTGRSGINIGMFSEGMQGYGFSSIVYPELESSYYLPLTLMTVLTAILSAIYPAIRSIRLKPSEAIRKI